MRTVLTFLPGLACAGGMAVMMWMMNRGTSRQSTRTPSVQPTADAQLADLRDEVARLRGEVAKPTSEASN